MEANRKRTRWTYAEFARLLSEGSTRYEIIAPVLECPVLQILPER